MILQNHGGGCARQQPSGKCRLLRPPDASRPAAPSGDGDEFHVLETPGLGLGIIEGADKLFPVDIFIPGCPPRPEALIEGILELEEKVSGYRRWPRVEAV